MKINLGMYRILSSISRLTSAFVCVWSTVEGMLSPPANFWGFLATLYFFISSPPPSGCGGKGMLLVGFQEISGPSSWMSYIDFGSGSVG